MLAAVIGLMAVLFFGVAWYLSGKIRSEALAIVHRPTVPAFKDVEFIALSPGKVQLRAIGDQPALPKPQLYGIAWQGGTGHLGASAMVSDGVVTRPLNVTSGSAPTIGQLAALDRSYFVGDPKTSLGIPMQEVVVSGPLGPLPAWYFPGRGTTFVIGVHGQNGTRKDVLRIVHIVHRMGFHALSVTYRNDPGVARDPSGYIQFGQTEWSDIEAAVQWSIGLGAQRVILAGQSMGGGVIAAFLKHSPHASDVTRIVLDAPMLDLHACIGNQVDRHTPPVIGRALTPLVWTAERIARARFGINWSATSYLDGMTWLKVPALVIHGDDDTTVPVSISIRLKELKPSLVLFERFRNAGHLESWNIDRVRYASLVESFLSPVAPYTASQQSLQARPLRADG